MSQTQREPQILHSVVPDAYSRVVVRRTYDLALLRNGAHDPTTRITLSAHRGSPAARIERATLTPSGPAAIRIHIDHAGHITSHAWGAGAVWMLERVDRLTAQHGTALALPIVTPQHRAVEAALHHCGSLCLPASDTPYHELLPAILGQRITAAQALAQWSRLCHTYGEVAPGPLNLRLPPTPERLNAIPSWEFHRLGIEQQRARALVTAARHASYIERTRELDGSAARDALMRLPGIGIWTAAVAVGVSHGDPDALPIGDFHVKNTVAWALNGRARGTDEEMVVALSVYEGQRWQVVRMLERSGYAAPRFAAKRRVLDIARL